MFHTLSKLRTTTRRIRYFAGLTGMLMLSAFTATVSAEELTDPEDPRYTKTEHRMTGEDAAFTASSPAKLSGYTHSPKFDGYDILKGIDVSTHQGTIDWEKVKADGIDFAIIRVAYRTYGSSGALYEDARYKENLDGAKAAGVDIGIYIYSQAITVEEAKEEAKYAISLVQGYDLELPVVMDYEFAGAGSRLRDAKLSKEEGTKICNAFCQTAENLGYTAMVYANKTMLTNYLNAGDIVNRYPIWLAQYNSEVTYAGDYTYWQYSSTLKVDGISGNVDCNFRYIKNPIKPGTLMQTDCTYTDNTLCWERAYDAYGYQLYRSTDGKKFSKIATFVGASNISFFDYDLTPGINYRYKVRAFYKLHEGNRYSAYTDILPAPTPALTTSSFKVSKQTTNSISLKWKENIDATHYGIFRSTDGADYEQVAELEQGTTSYKDKELKPGTKYYYQLRLGVPSSKGEIIYADNAAFITSCTRSEAPEDLTVSKNYEKSMKLTWSKVPRVTGYEIYRSVSKNGTYKLIATVKKASTKTYTDKTVTGGRTYYYKMRAFITLEGKNTYSDYTEITGMTTRPGRVLSLKATAKKNQVTLKWKNPGGATGYTIYRYDAKKKKYVEVGTTTKTSFTVKNLSRKKSYKFKVVPYRTYQKVKYTGTESIISVKTK